MPKCLSSCSKLPRDLCIKDECQYFNGDKKNIVGYPINTKWMNIVFHL